MLINTKLAVDYYSISDCYLISKSYLLNRLEHCIIFHCYWVLGKNDSEFRGSMLARS